jgi:hypothetical protein
MKLQPSDLVRYALWLGVLATARANQKHFHLPTTWVFHITFNSLFLFLPELYRGASQIAGLDARARQKRDLLTTTHGVMQDVVVTNSHYALYVAPVALAYIVSHPRFNIYRGEWAKIRLFGFGLDAIPHSATAFGFTNLVMDALDAFRRHTPMDASWRKLAQRADERSANIAGALLAGASAFYESGEYAIHAEELRETGGDEEKINMQWSAVDTLFDLISNAAGWAVAVGLRRRRRGLKLATGSK